MSYANETATYEAADIAPIVVDGIAALGVFFVTFATLVGLVLLFIWLRKRLK